MLALQIPYLHISIEQSSHIVPSTYNSSFPGTEFMSYIPNRFSPENQLHSNFGLIKISIDGSEARGAWQKLQISEIMERSRIISYDKNHVHLVGRIEADDLRMKMT